jgi:prophage regulatory protein
MQSTPKSEAVILRPAQVVQLICRSRSQLWRDVRAGKFPSPLRLGPNSIGWRKADVDAWLSSRPVVDYAPRAA